MNKKNNESFVRWQGRSIEQLGFLNNLLMGLSIGLLVFQINLIFSREVVLSKAEDLFFIVSLVFCLLSLIFGIYLAWNRLSSFGQTALIARKRETGKREDIEELRKQVKELDNKTWALLKAQMITFGLHIISLAALTIMYISCFQKL
jgi:hypothetical protein